MSKRAVSTGPLNKRGFAEALAIELDVSIKRADRIIEGFADIITRTVAAGHSVTVTNFGTWLPARTPEYKAHNPQTMAPMMVPARTVLRWRTSPRLAAIVAAGDPAASRRKRSNGMHAKAKAARS